jgi:hypothetical protein
MGDYDARILITKTGMLGKSPAKAGKKLPPFENPKE